MTGVCGAAPAVNDRGVSNAGFVPVRRIVSPQLPLVSECNPLHDAFLTITNGESWRQDVAKGEVRMIAAHAGISVERTAILWDRPRSVP